MPFTTIWTTSQASWWLMEQFLHSAVQNGAQQGGDHQVLAGRAGRQELAEGALVSPVSSQPTHGMEQSKHSFFTMS